MGLADTGLCVVAVPATLLSDLGSPVPFYPCLLLSCFVLAGAMVSSFHHLLMAYYRWRLVTHPHSYLTYVVFLCGVLLPLVAITVLYCQVFRAIRVHCKTTIHLSPSPSPSFSPPALSSLTPPSPLCFPCSIPSPRRPSPFVRRQKRVAGLTALLFALYFVSRLPFNLLNLFLLLCPSCPLPPWAPPLAILFAIFSAASNPLLYLMKGGLRRGGR
ncbi:adenosine receptor A1-like [Amia ocellicauda]|uniref:adenosine receptor A1-like n=1 Tax=Amia ocellicauda TaxID=2972642 RepID=UPI00346388F9